MTTMTTKKVHLPDFRIEAKHIQAAKGQQDSPLAHAFVANFELDPPGFEHLNLEVTEAQTVLSISSGNTTEAFVYEHSVGLQRHLQETPENCIDLRVTKQARPDDPGKLVVI